MRGPDRGAGSPAPAGLGVADAPGSSETVLGASSASRAYRAIPLLVFVVTFVAFLPALGGEFLNWDDQENLVRNEGYRGLGWAQVKWMFTTTLLGHYIPVTWLSFGLNYVLGGMDPWGYHLGNMLIHAANAAILYFVARRLLAAALPGASWGPRCLGAALTALVFGVHPLRAESVAWVTERRDVLCGLFFLLAVWTYLRAVDRRDRARPGWLALSVVAFAAALLSKAMAMTLPAVLVLLDVYPLRRVGLLPWRRWLWEKVPYAVLAGVGAVAALMAVRSGTLVTGYAEHGLVARIAMMAHSLVFYPWKLIWPVGLSPLYELPAKVNILEGRFLLALAALVVVTAALVALRHRVPGALAAWVYSAIVLAPVSGVVHAGFQLAHDRYSYLSGLGFAVVAGAALTWVMGEGQRGRVGRTVVGAAIGGAALAVAGLGAGVWAQSKIWTDSELLWLNAIESDPSCMICNNNFGYALLQKNDLMMAEAAFRRAISLRPNRAAPHNNLGTVLAHRGRYDEAAAEFREAVRLSPILTDARANLGALLLRQQKYAAAIPLLREAFRMNPDFPNVRSDLGQALGSRGSELLGEGQLAQATALFGEASAVLVNDAEALRDLGQALVEHGRAAEALSPLRRAVTLDPRSASSRFWLARAYLLTGAREQAEAEIAALKALDPAMASQLSYDGAATK